MILNFIKVIKQQEWGGIIKEYKIKENNILILRLINFLRNLIIYLKDLIVEMLSLQMIIIITIR